MPTQKQIENASVISEYGSFSKASEQLFVSPSALIQQINLLENEIGFNIFIRTKKGVQLTEAGRYYLSNMQQIQERVGVITETAQDIAINGKRTFRIGYLPGQSTKFAMELNRKLLAAFQNISVKLCPVTIDTAQDGLLSVKIDCCIMPHLKRNECYQLDGFVISKTPLMIGMHPELDLSRKEWVTFLDLQGQKIVLPKRGTFDTSDLFEDKLYEKNISFERITQNDHIAAETVCISEKACRINGTVVEGSTLIYRPLREDITFEMSLIFNKESYQHFKEYLEFIRMWFSEHRIDT